jgi:hypothetical protein
MRRLLKRALIVAYCHRLLPGSVVRIAFKAFQLKHS